MQKGNTDKSKSNTSHISSMQMAGRQRNIETFKIALLGAGQMFGEDDVSCPNII